ncbi:unnamed protein product, partial [Staurois parvus]
MLLPGPECVNGSLYGLPLLLSPSPHSAMCHFQVSSHTAGFHFVIGCWQITGLPLLLPGLNLPWDPVPPPHAAARSTVSHGSLNRLPLLLSPSPQPLCHVPLSGLTLLVCYIFC